MGGLNAEAIELIQSTLHQCNPFIGSFKAGLELYIPIRCIPLFAREARVLLTSMQGGITYQLPAR